MASQEFGDGQIICQVLQRLLELGLMNALIVPSHNLPIIHCPGRALDR